jgi:hypothetical protein
VLNRCTGSPWFSSGKMFPAALKSLCKTRCVKEARMVLADSDDAAERKGPSAIVVISLGHRATYFS